MRLPDDDELYNIDQTYLGPPRRYIAPMRHKAIFAWIAIGPISFVIAYKVGLEMTLLSVGILFFATLWASMTIADHATPERPVKSLFISFWHDLTAPREARKGWRATGEAYGKALRPAGSLGRHLRRARHRDEKSL